MIDLVAGLFGGFTALLPVFAKEVLHTDAAGAGTLRSMVAIGALTGGKTGAAIGAVIGGGGGTATVLATPGQSMKIEPETKVNFVLDDDFRLPVIRDRAD